jgi:diaminohydroxyphosphoribosylaminopyrimidine deaminase / 5-amino-6-(5-phosphoribosylamino)uracil reductase
VSFLPLNPNWAETGTYWFDLMDRTPRDELFGSLVFPKVGTVLTEDAAMFLALAVSLRGVGNVSPNPLVGAVILDRQLRLLATGYHQRLGQAHAEVHAMSQLEAGTDLAGCSLFVTLEPCAHEGKTPSCAKMIAASKLSKIIYGVKDPNPFVNGQGVDILLAANKDVKMAGQWQSRCERLIRIFLKNQQQKEIYIGLKVASTPSGIIAGDGTSRLWITGERARHMGHYLRLEYDAIAVGINTVLLDDPTLNVRHPKLEGRTPIRLVLDPSGVLLTENRPFKILLESPEKTIVVLPEGADDKNFLKKFGVRTLKLPVSSAPAAACFDWNDIKGALWSMGVMSLLIEGGAGLYRSAMAAQVVDGWHWFVGAERDVVNSLRWEVPQRLLGMLSKKESGERNSCGGILLGDDRLIEE